MERGVGTRTEMETPTETETEMESRKKLQGDETGDWQLLGGYLANAI